ncbi:MAG: type IV pilus modification protein PilV, partial [Herbaspirillum sp.]
MAQIPNRNDQRLYMSLRKQSGVGLIEVLIALVISSFALLGFAGLQLASLRYQKVAQFRSLASQYSADMADRVRANVVGAKDGKYVTADTYPTNTAVTPCTTSCTPTQIADQDIY